MRISNLAPRMNSSHEMSRTLMALNNMAVSLLQRGCYHQAQATLKDAIKLAVALNQVEVPSSSSSSSSESSSPLVSPAECRKLMQKGNICMAKACSANANAANELPIEVVILDFERGSLYDFHYQEANLTAIQIDHHGQQDSFEGLISSVVLQNFGLACYCTSKISTNEPKHTTNIVAKSLHLFCGAYSITKKEYMRRDDDFVHTTICIHVCIVVLINRLYILTLNERTEEIKEIAETLDQLLKKSQEMREADLTLGLLSVATPAAAA